LAFEERQPYGIDLGLKKLSTHAVHGGPVEVLG
jgi:hypothetical protein